MQVLVERYHEVVCEALHYVCAKNAVAQDIPTDAKLAFFNETRQASMTAAPPTGIGLGVSIINTHMLTQCFLSLGVPHTLDVCPI